MLSNLSIYGSIDVGVGYFQSLAVFVHCLVLLFGGVQFFSTIVRNQHCDCGVTIVVIVGREFWYRLFPLHDLLLSSLNSVTIGVLLSWCHNDAIADSMFPRIHGILYSSTGAKFAEATSVPRQADRQIDKTGSSKQAIDLLSRYVPGRIHAATPKSMALSLTHNWRRMHQ